MDRKSRRAGCATGRRFASAESEARLRYDGVTFAAHKRVARVGSASPECRSTPMAVLIPDSCPSKATAGEKRVYSLLRDALPDEFTAWYEPVVAGRHPDFSVLAADFGLLMLEVKGWYLGQIARATDREVELHRSEGGEVKVEVHPHPRIQVRDYVLGLVNELARNEHSILHQPSGEHRGRPCFPYGFGVVLTNITRAQIDQAGMGEIFPASSTLCRDEIEALTSAGDRAVIRRLREFFPAPFSFDPLTEDQLATIRGVMHREVVVRRRPATRSSVAPGQLLLPGAFALDVLDAQQEQLSRSLGQGHHVVFGIAGSGKTVLLLARARLMAAGDPTKRVLLLCYNKALAASLADQIGNDPAMAKVEVRHFDSWLTRLTGLRKKRDEEWGSFRSRMIAAVTSTPGLWTDADRYDAILIDEAHDFEPEWFKCVTEMLRGGPDGDLLIVLDGAQSLYGTSRQFTWKSVGVKAVGRSRRLDRNYRNTKQILEFAWQVAQSPIVEEETEINVRVLPRKASRQGRMPSYIGCETAADERVAIARIIADLKSRGFADRDIAVLYPRNVRGRPGIPGRIEALRETLATDGPVAWLSAEQDAAGIRRALAGPGVRLLTIHAAKGLEFRAVILASLDLLPSPIEPDEDRDSRLLYVGLTRANDEVFVTWSGRSVFTERVLRSNKVLPLADGPA